MGINRYAILDGFGTKMDSAWRYEKHGPSDKWLFDLEEADRVV